MCFREKENSDSSTSTPLHTNSWGSLNNNTTTNNITNNTNKNNNNNNNNSTPVMGNKTSSLNDNSWSASTTTSPDQSTTALGTYSAVGPKLELMKYANTEWQGDTSKAQTIKQVCI